MVKIYHTIIDKNYRLLNILWFLNYLHGPLYAVNELKGFTAAFVKPPGMGGFIGRIRIICKDGQFLVDDY